MHAMHMKRQCTMHSTLDRAKRGIVHKGLRPNVRWHSSWKLRSAKAAELINEANLRYRSGDRVQALNFFEEALREPGLTSRQKQLALYGATCVHASFGEVETAQSMLRQLYLAGLIWEDALQDPDFVQPQTSTQIGLQLKKFSQQLQQQSAAAMRPQTSFRPAAAESQQAPMFFTSSSSNAAANDSGLAEDIAKMLGTSTSDTLELDASPLGIAKRTGALLLALTALGVVLFYGGLALFPLDQSVDTEALDFYNQPVGRTDLTAITFDSP